MFLQSYFANEKGAIFYASRCRFGTDTNMRSIY